MRIDSLPSNDEIEASHDNFILDGHHRWAAHMALHEDVQIWRFEADFEDAIGLLFGFAGTYSYGDGAVHLLKAE